MKSLESKYDPFKEYIIKCSNKKRVILYTCWGESLYKAEWEALEFVWAYFPLEDFNTEEIVTEHLSGRESEEKGPVAQLVEPSAHNR